MSIREEAESQKASWVKSTSALECRPLGTLLDLQMHHFVVFQVHFPVAEISLSISESRHLRTVVQSWPFVRFAAAGEVALEIPEQTGAAGRYHSIGLPDSRLAAVW